MADALPPHRPPTAVLDLADVFDTPPDTIRDPLDPDASSPAGDTPPDPDSPPVAAGYRRALARLTGLARTVRRRRSSDDPTTSDSDSAADVAVPAGTTTRQVLITRGLQGLVILALLCGPVALLMGSGRSASPAPTRAATPSVIADISPQLSAADLASQCVITWLHATQGDPGLGRCFDTTTAATLPETPLFDASDARPSAVHRVTSAPAGALIYSVTTSVAVRPAGSSQPPTRRYYRLPVIIAGSSIRALTFPAPVPAPPTNLTTTIDYPNQPSPSSAIVTAAQGFLSAMLTGSGDVTRFTSPGATLGAITPPPMASITVSQARSSRSVTATDDTPADGQTNHLLLTLSAQPLGATAGNTLTVTYALSMTARAGRWEVTALDLAPATTGVQGDTSATTLGGDSGAGASTAGQSSSQSAVEKEQAAARAAMQAILTASTDVHALAHQFDFDAVETPAERYDRLIATATAIRDTITPPPIK